MSGDHGVRHLLSAVPERDRYRELQALEDAIKYRQARLAMPCLQCRRLTAGVRCDEHACDVALIAGYWQAARSVIRELSPGRPARAWRTRCVRVTGRQWLVRDSPASHALVCLGRQVPEH